MNIIKEYFERRKRKQLEEEWKLDDLEADSRQDAGAKLEQLTKAMWAMQCPINKMKTCWKGCVHYQKGWIYCYEFDLFTDRPFTSDVKPPTCKLWRK